MDKEGEVGKKATLPANQFWCSGEAWVLANEPQPKPKPFNKAGR